MSLSAWWFISAPQRGHFIVSARIAHPKEWHFSSQLQRDVFTTVAQSSRHPDQLFQELINSSNVCGIQQLSACIETILYGGEIHIPKNRALGPVRA